MIPVPEATSWHPRSQLNGRPGWEWASLLLSSLLPRGSGFLPLHLGPSLHYTSYGHPLDQTPSPLLSIRPEKWKLVLPFSASPALPCRLAALQASLCPRPISWGHGRGLVPTVASSVVGQGGAGNGGRRLLSCGSTVVRAGVGQQNKAVVEEVGSAARQCGLGKVLHLSAPPFSSL